MWRLSPPPPPRGGSALLTALRGRLAPSRGCSGVLGAPRAAGWCSGEGCGGEGGSSGEGSLAVGCWVGRWCECLLLAAAPRPLLLLLAAATVAVVSPDATEPLSTPPPPPRPPPSPPLPFPAASPPPPPPVEEAPFRTGLMVLRSADASSEKMFIPAIGMVVLEVAVYLKVAAVVVCWCTGK